MKLTTFLISIAIVVVARAAETSPSRARDEITTLRAEIARHDELYHRKNAPEIADAEYDRLRQQLETLEDASPDAARVGRALAGVGDDRSGLFQTYRHRVPMMSLEKGYTPSDLRSFHLRLVKMLGREDLEYLVEPKFDGLAVSLTYDKGKLIRAVTRGNGIEGDDITANVQQIAGVALELDTAAGTPAPDMIELRGEIYVPRAEFERVNAERDVAGEPRFANPRNLAAGTIRQRDSRDVARRGLRAVFFGVGACEPARTRPASQGVLHTTLERWGVPVMKERWRARGFDELVEAVTALGRAREGLPFPTDGAVIKLNSVAQQDEAGATVTAPRWALAYKFMPERVETQLRAITLQVGRTGVLTPVAELEPVQIGGSRVARATLHNREEIVRKDIRVGDFVYLEKAGEVIPAIVGVNLDRRPATAEPFEFPFACPECHAPLAQRDSAVAVRCPNHACPAQVRRRVEHFASKACLDIEGLGPAMIDALVGNAWVKDLPDLYRLRRDDLLTLGKHNAKSIDRLLAAIEKSKRAELWRVINGMGLPQVGASTAKDLARQCGSLAGLAEQGPNAVVVLAEPRYQDLIADLITVGFGPSDFAATAPATTTPIAGKSFVVTGTLPTLTRAQVIAKIETAGGKVVSAVSRTTHYAVVGVDPGTKLTQARELGIELLDEAALLRLIEER